MTRDEDRELDPEVVLDDEGADLGDESLDDLSADQSDEEDEFESEFV